MKQDNPPKILLIGYFSDLAQIACIFGRTLEKMGIEYEIYSLDYLILGILPASFLGKFIYKMIPAQNKKLEKLQLEIKQKIIDSKPNLILITGLVRLNQDVFLFAKERKIKVINYLTDDPWDARHRAQGFISNIPLYDMIFSSKPAIIDDLKRSGAKKIHFLPFGYDPFIHHFPRNAIRKKYDVNFIGTVDKAYAKFFIDFTKKFRGKFALFGGFWWKYPKLLKFYKGLAIGQKYCQALNTAKLNIGLLRDSSRDQSTTRSYEIAPCGGVGIYQDSPEHRKLFKNYPEYGFFKDPQDLAKKCEFLLRYPEKIKRLRKLGIKAVVNPQNTYRQRLEFMIKKSSQIGK